MWFCKTYQTYFSIKLTTLIIWTPQHVTINQVYWDLKIKDNRDFVSGWRWWGVRCSDNCYVVSWHCTVSTDCVHTCQVYSHHCTSRRQSPHLHYNPSLILCDNFQPGMGLLSIIKKFFTNFIDKYTHFNCWNVQWHLTMLLQYTKWWKLVGMRWTKTHIHICTQHRDGWD